MNDKDTYLLEEAYEEVRLDEGVGEAIEAIKTFGAQVAGVPEFITASLQWLGKAAIGGLAGVAITHGLAKIMQITATKIDKERQKKQDAEQGAVGAVATSEFERQKGEYKDVFDNEMPLEQQVKLRMEIAKKLQEMYPVKDKSFWVSALESAGRGLEGKVGVGIGAVLGVIATKLMIPIPTL